MKIMWWIFDSLIVLLILTGCPILWMSSHGLYHLLEKKVRFLFYFGFCFYKIIILLLLHSLQFTIIDTYLLEETETWLHCAYSSACVCGCGYDSLKDILVWCLQPPCEDVWGTGRGFINSLMLSSAVGFSFVLF